MGIQERRERERAARRGAVLDAARGLLRENGFNGTTTKRIAQVCELSEATLFWYFQSKDEIFTSLLFEGIEFIGQGLRAIAESEEPGDRALARVWRLFAQVRGEHPEYFQLFAYLAHPRSTASVSDDVIAEIARRSGDNFRIFADLLDQVGGAGRSRLVADLLWGSFVGLSVLRDSRVNLGARPHPTEEELAAAFELLLSGIAPELAEGAGP
jgi:AcrR family transcriptional regulator